jgi:hypothetical protein
MYYIIVTVSPNCGIASKIRISATPTNLTNHYEHTYNNFQMCWPDVSTTYNFEKRRSPAPCSMLGRQLASYFGVL